MAYNLMLEFSGEPDWAGVASRLRSLHGVVESFPIPAGNTGEPQALGISVPMRHADETGFKQLLAALEAAETYGEFVVVDMYSGESVPRHQWPSLRERLTGG